MLTVIYLLCNEGYLSTAERVQSRDLVEDAEFLADLLHRLMPTDPEVAGLLALIRLHRARAAARFGPDGELVQLPDQDRSRWDRPAIATRAELLRDLGHSDQARAADRRALELTANPAEQALLRQRIARS